jgi:hypothetical protein
MFIKDKNSQESYIHVCEGMTEKEMRQKALEIRKHDVSIFSFIKQDKGIKMEHLNYCTYCGCNLHCDEII